MKRYLMSLMLSACAVAPVFSQSFFRDTFNRADNTALGSPSGPSAGGYTESVTNPADARILSNQLDITNGAAGAISGNSYASALSGNGFTNLAAQTRWVQWTFNMRYNRATAPVGFDAGEYAIATVLTGTSTTLTGGNGYAVVYGRNNTNTIELVRFTGGLDADANLTSLIATGANPLGTVNDFGSFRVTFNPNTNVWQLFLRDDGAGAFVDPISGVNTLVGSATDSTFTASGNAVGFYWNHGGTNNQTAQFDNMTFAAVPEPTTWAMIGLGGTALVTGVWRLRRRKSTIMNTEVINDGTENE